MLTTDLLSGGRALRVLWLGWTLAPVAQLLRQYVFDDVAFLLSLVLVVGVDTVLGLWRGLVQRRVSSGGFARLFQKVAFYALFLVAVHAVARHTVNGAPNVLLTWLDSVAYSLILVRELLSILENSAAIGLYVPPRWLVARLELFDSTGRLEGQPVAGPAAGPHPKGPALPLPDAPTAAPTEPPAHAAHDAPAAPAAPAAR